MLRPIDDLLRRQNGAEIAALLGDSPWRTLAGPRRDQERDNAWPIFVIEEREPCGAVAIEARRMINDQIGNASLGQRLGGPFAAIGRFVFIAVG